MAIKVNLNGIDVWCPGQSRVISSLYEPAYYPAPVYNASGCDDLFHEIDVEHEHAKGIRQLLESGNLTTKDLDLILQQFKLKRVEQILSAKVLNGKSFTSSSVQKAIADFEVEQMLKEKNYDENK